MGEVKAMRPRVKVGAHWDANAKWAREPKLSGVLDLRERREQRRYELSVEWVKFAAFVGAGYLLTCWLHSAL